MDMNPLAPWLDAPMRRATEALASDRLSHALLVCGPAHIGKRAFAEALAQAMLCRQRVDGAACGHCRDCGLFAHRTPVDPAEVRPDGTLLHPHGAPSHPDFRHVGYAFNDKTRKMFTVINVEQMRDLGAWFALTSQRGGAQVALVEPADAMNDNASNALLKTLEEPLRDRYLILLCESPMQVSATIRSRCQRIELQLPRRDVALAWLAARGHAPDVAASALDAARGHPGLAAHWIDEGLLALRDGVRGDLDALASGRATALDTAAAWLADGNAAQRLAFAADLALDLQAQALDAAQRGKRWTAAPDAGRLGAWFDAANRARGMLRSPVRQDLALAGLLRDWRLAVGTSTPGARAG